jgi:hypothetical protein
MSPNANPSDSTCFRMSGVELASPVLIRMWPSSPAMRNDERSWVPTQYRSPTIRTGGVGRVQSSVF